MTENMNHEDQRLLNKFDRARFTCKTNSVCMQCCVILGKCMYSFWCSELCNYLFISKYNCI